MTSPALKPVARVSVVDAVAEQLREQILLGGYAPGARLPAERDLAERFGVNRLTLRAALARLEALGLIATRHGTGTVVQSYQEHGGIDTLPDLLRVTRAKHPAGYAALARDVLDLRRTLAAEAVALASQRHTAADLAALRVAARAQATRVTNVLAFARGDLAFARLVVRAGRSVGLELLLNTIACIPEQDPELARAMYPRPRAQARHYATVIALIESGQADVARAAMRTALERIDRATLALIDKAAAPAHRAAATRAQHHATTGGGR